MSASGSEPQGEAFVEHEERETAMPYDKGGVPIYVAVLWVGFIVAYVTVMALLALPDLRAWLKQP